MARGGGSGGGRSMGGGGGRSFGGRSGGSGHNRGGMGGRSGFGGMGTPRSGGHRPFPSPLSGGIRIPTSRPRGSFGHQRGFGMGGGLPGRQRGGCGTGCLTGIILIIIVLVLFSVASQQLFNGFMTNSGSSGNVTASTIVREALPPGSVNETEYYTDELGWIGNRTTLLTGMKNFYKKTGVQPYLYLTDTIDGSHNPSDAQVEQFAYDTYDTLFTDEAHLLLIFFEYGDNYHTWYLAGVQAKTVLDNEAMDILLDHIDKYYYDQGLTDEQMFSTAFDKAGTRIMEVTTSPWIPVWGVAGVLVIVVVAFIWWKNYKKQKNREAEQTQRILDTPLETFGDSEAIERAKKYEE